MPAWFIACSSWASGTAPGRRLPSAVKIVGVPVTFSFWPRATFLSIAPVYFGFGRKVFDDAIETETIVPQRVGLIARYVELQREPAAQ